MSILCNLTLVPTPSSRAAEQPPDWTGAKEFEVLPRKGDWLRLDEDWMQGLAGRRYMVDHVEWSVPLNGTASRPTVTAMRF